MADLQSPYLQAGESARYKAALDLVPQIAQQDWSWMNQGQPTGPPPTQDSIPVMAMKSVKRGLTTIGSDIGGVVRYAGALAGNETLQDVGKVTSDFYDEMLKNNPTEWTETAWEKPALLLSPRYAIDKIAEGIPSIAAFMLPGFGAARAVKVAGKMVPWTAETIARLANIGQKVASSAAMGGMELGSVFNEVKARGGSDEDAISTATMVGMAAAGLGAVNLHYLLGGAGGGVAKSALQGGVSNTVVGYLMGGSRAVILGDDVFDALKSSVANLPGSFTLGAAAGAAAGLGNKRAATPSEPAKAESPKGQTTDARKTQTLLLDVTEHPTFKEATTRLTREYPSLDPMYVSESVYTVMREKPFLNTEGVLQAAGVKLASGAAENAAVFNDMERTAVIERMREEFNAPKEATPEAAPKVDPKILDNPNFGDMVNIILEGKKKPSNAEKSDAIARAIAILQENPTGDRNALLLASAAQMGGKDPMRTKAPTGEAPKSEPLPVTNPTPGETPPLKELTQPPVESDPAKPPVEPSPVVAETAKAALDAIPVPAPAPKLRPATHPENWPGLKEMTVDDRAASLVTLVQTDAASEAGRIRQKRGTVTFEQEQANAQALLDNKTFTLDTIINAKEGTIWNNDQGHAAMRILQALANRVAKLYEESLREYSGVNPEQADSAFGIFKTAAENVSAVASETGRALHGMQTGKEAAPPWTLGYPELQWGGNIPPNHPFFKERNVNIAEVLKAGSSLGEGGDPRLRAEMIAGLKTAEQKTGLASLWVRTGRATMELFYGSLLTPISAAKNILSVAPVVGYTVAVRKAGEVVSTFRRTIAPDKLQAAENLATGEAGAGVAAIHQGVVDAWRIIKLGIDAGMRVDSAEGISKRVTTGQEAIRQSAMERGDVTFDWREPAITAANFPEVGRVPILGEMLSRAVDILGTVARMPGTMMGAGDLASKIINDRVGLAMQAHRIASIESKGNPEAFAAEYARLIQERPPIVDDAARAMAERNSFTDGGMLANGSIINHPLMRIFALPFWKTPIQIGLYALEGTPVLQHLSSRWWADMNAGGARRDLAVAKVGVAWTAALAVGGMAASGLITGAGSRDPERQKINRDLGIPPKSIWVGTHWVSYDGMEPLSTWIGAVADFTNIANHLPEGNAAEVLSAILIAGADNFMTKRYVQGFSNWLNAMTEKDIDKAIDLVKRQLAPPLPFQGTLRIARRYADDGMRESRGVVDQYMNSVPGWSDSLPPQRNVITGETQHYEGAWGPDWLSPFYTTTPKPNKVLEEMNRLGGVGISRLPDQIGGKAEAVFAVDERPLPGVPISPQQRDRWSVLLTQEVKISGKTLEQAMQHAIDSPMYAGQSDGRYGGKAGWLYGIYSQYRREAENRLIGEDKDLQTKVQAHTMERAIQKAPTAMQPVMRGQMTNLLSTLGR